MKLVLYEPGGEARTLLCHRLRDLGCGVAAFGETRTAFLFLLGRLHEIDGVMVNVAESGQGSWLMERLALLRDPLVVVTYRDVEASEAEVRGFVAGAPAEASAL